METPDQHEGLPIQPESHISAETSSQNSLKVSKNTIITVLSLLSIGELVGLRTVQDNKNNLIQELKKQKAIEVDMLKEQSVLIEANRGLIEKDKILQNENEKGKPNHKNHKNHSTSHKKTKKKVYLSHDEILIQKTTKAGKMAGAHAGAIAGKREAERTLKRQKHKK